MVTGSLNSIIKPRSLINQRFLGFVLAKCLQFEENATNKQVREYLQPLPSDDVIESYLPHDRQTTVRSDSLVTYHNCKYSVPPEYIGKPVRLLVSDNTLRIYSSTDLIAVHALSTKRMNYQKDHYQQLLTQTMKEADMVAELAEVNLKQMDAFL